VRQITGRPIMFASTGEKLEDFDVFHPDRMAGRILDMGDVLTLIEQAEQTFDAEQTAKMTSKFASGEDFTLEDLLEQMSMVRKLGPIKNLLGMMPGMAQMRGQLDDLDDRELDRVAGIINSMTLEERRNPKIINGSRRARIAGGSGVTVTEVNNLITKFFESQKMMRQMAGGLGLPGMGGGRRKATKAPRASKGGKGKKGKKAGRSGDPRKRAAAAAQEAQGTPHERADQPATPKGLPPGLGGPPGVLPPGIELPDLSHLHRPKKK
jgi:signal recognition particle subunit SRP54